MEAWWPLRFPQRMLMAIRLAGAPLRALALAADVVLACAILAVGAAAWGLHSGAIPQEDAERMLRQFGEWALSMLRRQGVY